MIDEASLDFGLVLRRLRRGAGLSQEALAERAQLSTDAVGALERGLRTRPHRDTVVLLADALGLAGPQRAQLVSAAARRRAKPSEPDRPTLHLVRYVPNNLPSLPTSFIGRERETGEIEALLTKHRLVTLAGAPGVGKTRVALRVASQLREGPPDGVWLVELAPLRDPAFVPGAIAASLGLQLPSGRDPLEALSRALRPKALFLILDNCEHLVEAVAPAAATLARECPALTILATSRQALRAEGEITYRVPSLTVPPEGSRLRAAEARQYDAPALFAERAASADARFVLRDEEAPIVADICRRLDGIPLAIELAAARVWMLSLSQLRRHLDERFRLLTRGNRAALPRQQTLRSTIDWSYDLLDARERALFCRTGIFLGGFTLESATAVCTDASLDELDVIDALASLVDKSLVVADLQGEITRYGLLESVRSYALEKVEENGERTRLAGRHLTHFRNVVDRVSEAMNTGGTFAPLSPEADNIRTALDWSLCGGDVTTGAALAGAVWRLWHRLGLNSEGIAWLERFIAAIAGTDPAIEARLWYGISWHYSNQSRMTQALEAAERSIIYGRLAGDSNVLPSALAHYACVAANLKRLEAADEALDEAERLATAPTPLQAGFILEGRGFVAMQGGHFDTAARAYESALERLPNPVGKLGIATNLAEVEYARGNAIKALAIAKENLPKLERERAVGPRANQLVNMAGYLAILGATSEALGTAREAITLVRSNPNSGYLLQALEHYALSLALDGHASRAARLFGYCNEACAAGHYFRTFSGQGSHDRLTAILSERFSQGELEALTAQGAAMTPQAAIDEALSA